MAKVICIYSQKGGSSKTTTSINLAYTLKHKGFNVILLDLDIQSSLSKRFGITEAFIETNGLKTTENIFLDDNVDVSELLYKIDDKISIIPSNPRLKLSILRVNAFNQIMKPKQVLDNYFKKLNNNYFVIIDTIGSENPLSTGALMLSSNGYVLTTSIPSLLGLAEIEPTFKAIKDVAQNNNGYPKKIGILLCNSKEKSDVARQTRAYLESKEKEYNTFVYGNMIRYSIDIPESEFAKEDVNTYLGNFDFKEVKIKVISKRDMEKYKQLKPVEQAKEIFNRIAIPKKITSGLSLPIEAYGYKINYYSNDENINIEKPDITQFLSIDKCPYGKYQSDLSVVISKDDKIIDSYIMTLNIVKNNVGYDYQQFTEELLEKIGD